MKLNEYQVNWLTAFYRAIIYYIFISNFAINISHYKNETFSPAGLEMDRREEELWSSIKDVVVKHVTDDNPDDGTLAEYLGKIVATDYKVPCLAYA